MLVAHAPKLLTALALAAAPLDAHARVQLFEELHRSTPTELSSTPAQLWQAGRPFLADFDRDGDLDALFSVKLSNSVTLPVLYQNDGKARFSERAGAIPSTLVGSPVAIGDIDGDGDLDVLAQPAAVWLNQGNGSFELSVGPTLPGFPLATCGLLVDVDGDLDLDAVLGTESYGNRLLLNDGHGNFVDASHEMTPGLWDTSAIDLGDIDGDGDLDLAIASRGPLYYVIQQTKIYLNDGLGTFAYASAALPSFLPSTTCLDLADLDADGDLDLVLGNSLVEGYGGQDMILKNDGAGHFTTAAGLLPTEGAWINSIEAIDLDGDQDLDLAEFSKGVRVYVQGASGTFALFDPLPVESSYYILSGRVIACGDLDQDGDADFMVNQFGGLRVYLNDGSARFVEVTGPVPAHTNAWDGQGLADVDFDGDLDLLLGGWTSNPLCLGDGTGVFAPKVAFDPSNTYLSRTIWKDFDGDGDLDVFATDGYYLKFYLGEPGPRYVGPVPGLPSSTSQGISAIEAGDIDGDGDLDVLISGSGQDRMFVNQGAAVFADESWRLPAETETSDGAVLVDLDSDGDLDAVIANGFYSSPSEQPRSRIYFNDGAGHFQDSFANLNDPGTGAWAVAHGDVDGDGDIDLVLSIRLWTRGLPSRLFLNDGSGAFVATTVPLPANPGPNNMVSALALSDLDGDGDLDLIEACGFGAPRALLNDGSGAFTVAEDLLPRGLQGWNRVTTGDIDADGDVDLVSTRPGGVVTCWTNLSSQLARVNVPRIGGELAFDLYGSPGSNYSLVGSRAASSPTAPFGASLLDPSSTFFHASGTLDANGRARELYPVPPNPGLLGVTFYWQARLGSPARWTNLEKTLFDGL